MSEMLSVVIPFFSTPENLFRNCMESLLHQDLTNIEIIVVDDGSPREDNACLAEYAEDSRVRIIYAEHEGVSSARNRGIVEAKGSYLMFVDSDDYTDHETLKRILDGLSGFTGDVELFGGGMDKDGTITKNTTFLKEKHDYGQGEKDKLIIMGSALSAGRLPEGYIQKFTYGSPCSKLFRRCFLIEEHLCFDKEVRFAEDCLFMLHVYAASNSIYYHDWYLYNYVNNGKSVTRKFRPGLSTDMDVFFGKVSDFLERSGMETGLETAYYVRAGIEVERAFKREFFHPQNQDKNAKKHYMEFIGKEPYRTALKNYTQPGKNLKQIIARMIYRHGWGRLYKIAHK